MLVKPQPTPVPKSQSVDNKEYATEEAAWLRARGGFTEKAEGAPSADTKVSRAATFRGGLAAPTTTTEGGLARRTEAGAAGFTRLEAVKATRTEAEEAAETRGEARETARPKGGRAVVSEGEGR